MVLTRDFSVICRACLSKDEQLYVLKDEHVLDIINYILKTEVNQESILPKRFCSICSQFLENIHEFIERCKTSDEVLHAALLETACCEDNNFCEPVVSPDCSDTETNTEETFEQISREDNEPLESIERGPADEAKSIKIPPKCACCGEKFNLEKELKKHLSENSDCMENRFKCNICSKKFPKKFKLQAHVRCHTKETPFECKICSKTFRYSQNLRRHRKTHEGKLHVCHICDKAFSRRFMKEEHMRKHTGETPYVCNYCGKSFQRYNSHRAHIMLHKVENGELPDEQKKIYEGRKCSKCDKRFISKSALENHEVLHTGEKKYLCSDCGKSFYTKGALDSHVKVHTGIKPYVCQKCDKSFSQKKGLRDHVLIHMGVKPHTCDICNRSFVQSSHLKNHMRTHTGEKPYICNYCGKSFALNCNLKVHIRTHTGETPFHCPVCSLGFYDSSSLKKHKSVHEQVSSENIEKM